MKRKILVLGLIVICMAIAATGSLAFYTADVEAHNVITSGGVNIQIEEWQKTDEGLTEYPKEEIQVMPGTVVSKIVTVKNLEADAYVRAKFDLVAAFKGIPEGSAPAIPDDLITVEINEAYWMRKDGDTEWWYYKEALKAGDATEPLFTEVRFSGPQMGNEFQNSTVDVKVKAQAVQADNNGSSALDAEGWSAE